MKLLIACDDTTETSVMAQDLSRAGIGDRAQAVVLCVADLIRPMVALASTTPAAVRRAHERVARELELARGVADAMAAALRATFPHWTVSPETDADSPAWAIVRKAADWSPDLIVVGSHSHSSLSRMLLGSVSQAVLANASRSVRIVRSVSLPANRPPRLLIAADGSPEARLAAERVAGRSWPTPCEVRVVTALDDTLASMLDMADGAEDPRVAAAQLADDAARPLRAAGLRVETTVLEGHPKRVLIEEAERWQADCIFIGARGLRGLQRFVLGGVSASVAARAHCSVEVVRS